MITALQHFISKKGKFVFVLLLLVVIVSFVLYLAQGSSVFDLFPDPNRQRKDFYGTDLNDPDKNRLLSMTNRVASDFGAIVEPLSEDAEVSDRKYIENVQARLQTALQSNQEDMDRSSLQRMIGFIQSWPNLPKSYKIREVARSGSYDFAFSQSSIRAKIIMDHLAGEWDLLPLNLNDSQVNSYFGEYVQSLDPALSNEENRTMALKFVGQRNGFSVRDVESILYSHYRALKVDEVLSQSGLAMTLEAELDLHMTDFAWDADIYSIRQSDSESVNPAIFEVVFESNPKKQESLSISYGSKNGRLVFSDVGLDSNATDQAVELGMDVEETCENLTNALKKAGFDFLVESKKPKSIFIIPKMDKLPAKYPQFSSSSDGIILKDILFDDLSDFFQDRKASEVFTSPPRTVASAITFSPEDFLTLPSEPDEARMKSYFERNRLEFEKIPSFQVNSESNDSIEMEESEIPALLADTNTSQENQSLSSSTTTVDDNGSLVPEVTFDQVKDQVRERIMEGDRIDAERYAEDEAREQAMIFLDGLNTLGDSLSEKYDTYSKRRNSTEVTKFLAESGGKIRTISFARRDMAVQGSILGLQRRESERRSNRQPLEDVEALNERIFFTRSIRKSRDGFVVFVLDGKTERSQISFDEVSYSLLYEEFSKNYKTNIFSNLTDEVFESLCESNSTDFSRGRLVSVKTKDKRGVTSFYTTKSAKISSDLQELEDERQAISKAERETNATALQIRKKVFIDDRINSLRTKQSELNRDRVLANKLVEACPDLEPNSLWSELQRSQNEAVFVRLNDVYAIRGKILDSDMINDRVKDLELAKAETARDRILKSLKLRELRTD